MTTVEASPAVLDNAVWTSLRGAHSRFAEAYGAAVRYQSEVAPFHAVEDPDDPRAWSDLAELTGPAAEVAVAGGVPAAHPGWEVAGVCVVGTGAMFTLKRPAGREDDEADPSRAGAGPGRVPGVTATPGSCTSAKRAAIPRRVPA